MSPPPAAPRIAVRPEAVAALAAELSALGGELADDAERCRAAAASLCAALSADDGLAAGSAAGAWGGLTGTVAARSAALSATLLGALTAYRAADVALSARIDAGGAAARVGGR